MSPVTAGKGRKFISYESLQQQRMVLAGLVLALVAVFVWVGVELATSEKTSQIDPELKRLSRPLNPTLNTTVLNRIEQYEYVSPDEARQVVQQSPVVTSPSQESLELEAPLNESGEGEGTAVTEPESEAVTPATTSDTQAPAIPDFTQDDSLDGQSGTDFIEGEVLGVSQQKLIEEVVVTTP